MAVSYWQRTLPQRIARRRVLALTASGLSAAFLIACSGGDERPGKPSESDQSGGLLTKATDTSNSAKRGGTYITNLTADPQHLDPHVTLSGSARAYSLLLNQRAGHLEQPDGSYQGEAAQSFEFSPDGLQV